MLMEQLTFHELLCGHRLSLGSTSLDCPDAKCSMFDLEDDYASDGSPGIANFMTSAIGPLEAQGRGFEHAHKKVTGVPASRIAALQSIFQQSDEVLQSFMQRMRDAVLQAASTLQYESATLPAEQLGVTVPPEPFSTEQQSRSRLDGGLEVDGETRRDLLEVTAAEPQGHVVRERTLAEAEQRSFRNPYRQVPLTGCHQSMLPCYRSSAAVGHIISWTSVGSRQEAQC